MLQGLKARPHWASDRRLLASAAGLCCRPGGMAALRTPINVSPCFNLLQGFPSKPRSAGEGGLLASAEGAEAAKSEELRRGLLGLGFAWGLVAVCCAHHVGHAAHALGWHEYAHTPLMHALGSPGVSAALGAVALLGPGRKLLTSGVMALVR